MKYRYINPEVTVQLLAGDPPAYQVTHPPGGRKEIITPDELTAKYKPSLDMKEVPREMYRICTQIIDLEAMVDEDNAESLVADAVDLAKQLRRLIQ
jgi:hypothetical protein